MRSSWPATRSGNRVGGRGESGSSWPRGSSRRSSSSSGTTTSGSARHSSPATPSPGRDRHDGGRGNRPRLAAAHRLRRRRRPGWGLLGLQPVTGRWVRPALFAATAVMLALTLLQWAAYADPRILSYYGAADFQLY